MSKQFSIFKLIIIVYCLITCQSFELFGLSDQQKLLTNQYIDSDKYGQSLINYEIHIFPEKVILNIQSVSTEKNFTFLKQTENHFELFNHNQSLILQNSQSSQQFYGYINRITTYQSIKWQYFIQYKQNKFIKDTLNQSSFEIIYIGLIYVLINLCLLPPLRKYLSIISMKIVWLSLLSHLQNFTSIILILLSNLILRLYSLQASFNNVTSLMIIIFVLIFLLGYEIGFSFCLLRIMERYQLLYSKPKIIKCSIIGVAVGTPIALAFYQRGLIYHCFCFLSVLSQIVWCYYNCVQVPIRYLLHSILTIIALISYNYYYPILHFKILSLHQISIIIILVGGCLLLIFGSNVYIYLNKFKQNSKFNLQNQQRRIAALFEGSQDKLRNEKGEQIPLDSQKNVIENIHI